VPPPCSPPARPLSFALRSRRTNTDVVHRLRLLLTRTPCERSPVGLGTLSNWYQLCQATTTRRRTPVWSPPWPSSPRSCGRPARLSRTWAPASRRSRWPPRPPPSPHRKGFRTGWRHSTDFRAVYDDHPGDIGAEAHHGDPVSPLAVAATTLHRPASPIGARPQDRRCRRARLQRLPRLLAAPSRQRGRRHIPGAGRSALQQVGVPLLRRFRRSAKLAAPL
jgi:hypothetical protein